MHVAIEIPYYAGGVRGPSQYGENLVRALGAASPRDEFTVFTYFHRDFERHLSRLRGLEAANVRLDVRRWSQRAVDLAERDLGYPWVDRRFLRSSGADVFHDSNAHPVDTARTPVVYAIHGAPMDLIRVDPYFERVILPQMLKATRLIAVTRSIRDFVLKHYPVDPRRMAAIPYGVDHGVFRPIEDSAALDAVRRKYSLPERFLLCVGPFQFRDNVEHLLYALRAGRSRKPLQGVRAVLVGGMEDHGLALKRRVAELQLGDIVRFPGFIPHDELAAVYSMALALVHGSYYEEGGAQLAEATACGCPILASGAGGSRDNAGDGALYFNPHFLDDFEAVLFRLLESEDLRRELRGKGIEWSRRFSWESAARQTLEVYRDAASGR